MKKFKSAIVTCCVAGLILAATGSSHAFGVAARTTYLTFHGPVALPGVELAAGTYIFELADPLRSPTLVRVTTRDRRKNLLLAFTNTVPRPRTLKSGTAAVSLGEAQRGVAPPVTGWYPADDSSGHEFIYRR